MGLRMRLEDDPYSLTQDELMALKSNDQLNSKLNGLLKDAFVQRAVLPARNHWQKLLTALCRANFCEKIPKRKH